MRRNSYACRHEYTGAIVWVVLVVVVVVGVCTCVCDGVTASDNVGTWGGVDAQNALLAFHVP